MTAALILAAFALTLDADLQRVLELARTNQQVPGLAATVTYRGDLVFAGGAGVADLETRREMSADTVVYAGSLTKIMTAMLALQLVERGKLSLDDTLGQFTGSMAPDDIRLSHLLTHSSGLEREGNFDYWFTADFPDAAALADYLLNAEPAFPPGDRVRYSNVGYAVLGRVVEVAGGRPFGELLRERVLEPLHMAASGAPGPAPQAARGYTPVGRVIPSAERPFAGVGAEIDGRRLREYHDAKAMTPAFGAWSTATDLSRLARFLLGYGGEDVLSREMRTEMLKPQASGRSFGLGVGLRNGRQVVRHNGWFAAHRSHLLIDLQSQVGIVVIGNSDSAASDETAEALLDAVLETGDKAE